MNNGNDYNNNNDISCNDRSNNKSMMAVIKITILRFNRNNRTYLNNNNKCRYYDINSHVMQKTEIIMIMKNKGHSINKYGNNKNTAIFMEYR